MSPKSIGCRSAVAPTTPHCSSRARGHRSPSRGLQSTPCLGSARNRKIAKDYPLNPREEMVACIWAEMLGLEHVGRHQDFFDLGGHSLLAIQVTHRLEGLFGVRIPLRTLFERPTVSKFAACL